MRSGTSSSSCTSSSFGRFGLRLALLSTTLIAGGVPIAAHAQSAAPGSSTQAAQTNFNVPPQALDSALTSVADQGGVRIFFTSAEVAGVRSNGVSGVMSIEQALSQVLNGTGFTWHFQHDRTVVIEHAPQAQGAIQLGPVRVEGNSTTSSRVALVPSTAVLGNLPKPYAGGQVAEGARIGVLGNRAIMDTPLSVTSYTAQTIDDQQAKTLADVLVSEPSIRLAFNPTNNSDRFTFRGLEYSSSDATLDGLPAMLDTYRIPVELYERVEIVKGPSTFINGYTGSVSGAINFIPKIAVDDPITSATLSFVSDSVLGGSIDIGRRFGLEKNLGARLAATYRKGESYVDGNTEMVVAAEFNLDYRLNNFRVNASLGYKRQEIDAVFGFFILGPAISTPPPPNPRTNNAAPWSFGDTTHYHATVRAEYDVGHLATLYAAFGHSWVDTYTFGAVTGFIQNNNGDLTISSGYSRLAYRNNVFDVGGKTQFTTGRLTHNIVLSFQGQWKDEYYRYVAAGGSLSSNIYRKPVFPEPIRSGIDLTGKHYSRDVYTGAAISDTISWNERIFATIGARFVRIKNLLYNDVTGERLRGGYAKSATTPFIGLLVKPVENVSVYASYAESLQSGDTAPVGTVNAGEIFSPFVTKQIEVGAKYDLGKLTLSLAAFEIRQPSSFVDAATNRFGQDGLQKNRGLELSALGEVLPALRLLGGVTFQGAKLERTAAGVNEGNTPAGVPEFSANIGAEWDNPFVPNLILTGRAIHTSGQFVNPANTQSIPAWTRVDVGARYVIGAGQDHPVTLRLSVENVFNKTYWANAARGFLSVGAPRVFRISASTNF